MHASTVRQISASFIITLSVLMTGTFFGWPSPVAHIMRSQDKPLNMTSAEESWMVTCIEIGNLILPVPAGYLMDAIGRRACLMASVPPALIGWTLIRYTRDVWCLYAARILHGCAMAITYTVTPVYLGEIAGVNIRGSLGLFFQGMNSSGVLFVYIVGWTTSYDTLAVAMGVVPILMITLLTLVPESPHYLAMKGRDVAALQSLSWLRSSNDKAELEKELESMTDLPSEDHADGLLKKYRKQMVIVLIMGTCQIFSGISALEAYASTAFEINSKDNNNSTAAAAAEVVVVSTTISTMTADACAVLLGLVALSSDILSAVVIDRFGRRPLLLASCVGCCISHTIAAYGMYRGLQHRLLVLISLAGVVFFANAGIMPLVTASVCEYFPTSNRARANAIAQLVITVASLVSLKIYRPIADVYGVYANYVLFAGVSAFTVAFVYQFVPETKGKTFNEIESLFKVKKSVENVPDKFRIICE